MSRNISPDVSVGDLTLRLDMTALFDFEEHAGVTVSEFLSPIIDIIQGEDFGALQGVPDEEKNRVGLGLLNTVLSSGVIAAKNLLVLVWAMAGGEDLEEEPREFGRRINWQNRTELTAAMVNALKLGSPDNAGEVADEEETEGEDPTASPELPATGQ